MVPPTLPQGSKTPECSLTTGRVLRGAYPDGATGVLCPRELQDLPGAQETRSSHSEGERADDKDDNRHG